MAKLQLIGVLLALCLGAAFALPVGIATVTAGTPVTLGNGSAGTAAAWGGNITQVNLTINSSTLHWQGFFGSVTGSLTLGSTAGSNTSTLRTWSVNTINGQVYASTSSSIDFTAVNSTSVTLANVDSAFSFLSGANDAAANTGTANANPTFYVGQYNVSANTRPLITTLNSTGSSVWQEVILADGTPTSANHLVFTGLLNNSGIAYNNASANFQLIVPDNSAGDNNPTTYYFYAELQ